MIVMYVQRHYIQNLSDGSYYQKIDMKPMMPCADLLLRGFTKSELIANNSGYFDGIFDKNALCVDRYPGDKIIVQGQGLDSLFITANVEIYPCSLGTGCMSGDDLGKVGIIVSRGQKSIDLANYESPVKSYITGDDYTTVNLNIIQYWTGTLMNYRIIDTRGFLTSDQERVHFSRIGSIYTTSKYRPATKTECTLTEIQEGSCPAYHWFSLISGGASVTVQRS